VNSIPTLSEKGLKRFWSKVHKTDGCWLWNGTINRGGYGISYIARKPFYAHRISAEIAKIKAKDGELICHRCDVRNCVNPAHLFAGSYSDNNLDCRKKGRASCGEDHSSAKLTKQAVIAIRREAASGDTRRKIAIRHGVSAGLINGIVNGIRWRHLM